MPYPIWLKTWLGIFGIPVFMGLFPFIVMYFKINGNPVWKLPMWQENKIANYFIAVPKGGYSRETWIAIRPQPLLFLLIGIGYFIFLAFLLLDSIWALPLGLIVLPLVLLSCYLYDFGMDAEWHHGGFKPSFFVQEILLSAAILIPLVYLIMQLIDHIVISG